MIDTSVIRSGVALVAAALVVLAARGLVAGSSSPAKGAPAERAYLRALQNLNGLRSFQVKEVIRYGERGSGFSSTDILSFEAPRRVSVAEVDRARLSDLNGHTLTVTHLALGVCGLVALCVTIRARGFAGTPAGWTSSTS